MKTSSKIIAAVSAAAALALAGAAIAQPGFGPGGGFGCGGGFGMGPGGGAGWGGGPGMMGRGPGMGAWGGGPGMMGGGPGFGGGFDMSAAAAGRLAAMKAQLKITAAQEPAWQAYEAAVTEQAKTMQGLRDQFHAQWQNQKPGEAGPDVAAHRQAMFAQMQSSRQAQGKAMQDLLRGPHPEQQALVTGGWGGGPRRR